jgi:serine/threonine protein phosphatase PrpC
MEFVVAPGDRMLLCSDGLWDELTPDVIGQSLATATSPRGCASELVALANVAGGNDNSTAVVIFFEAEPEDNALRMRGAAPEAADEEAAAQINGAHANGTTPAPSPDGETETTSEAASEAEPEATAEPPAATE